MTSPENQETVRANAIRQLLIETAASTTRRPASRISSRRAPLILAGALAVGLAVIPLVQNTTEPDLAAPAVTTEVVEAPLLGPSGGLAADTYIYASPAEMAKYNPLVFRGTVQSVTLGSEQTGLEEPTQFGEVPILVLRDLRVAQGSLDLRDDGTVLFALFGYHVGTGHATLADIALQYPEGTEIVAYAQQGWLIDNSWGVTSGPPPADMPRPITTPGNIYTSMLIPQGFIVQRPDSTYLHWPYLNDTGPAVGDLAETLPGGNLIGNF